MELFGKMKTVGLAAAAFAVSASSAFAQSHSGWRWDWSWWQQFWNNYQASLGNSGGGGASNAVPEIDAGAGLLAVAAVLATLALAWELRRRSRTDG
ncbi:VPEID-CTERM sorting domain-containing protein [Shimia sp. R10_1]|nr:VPEID-CTERM sorting domain-containing protein [Shimia sp. R10_1]